MTIPEAGALEFDRGPKTPPAKPTSATALRASLDVDQAEGQRRATIMHRQRVFRRTLAAADAVSASAALFIGVVLLGSDHLTAAMLGAIALVVLAMKATGLYDRDAALLHKTTLEDVPLLFQVATLSTLMLWAVGDQIVGSDLGRNQVLGIWALLFFFLTVGRALARYTAARLSEPERCLLIGDADSRELLETKLSLNGFPIAEVVDWIPAVETRTGSPGAAISMIPQGLYTTLAERQIHRVVVAPGKVDSDALLHLVRELSAMHVAVSVMPATPPVAGSSVELDHIHGLTLLGVRGFEISRSSRLLKRVFDIVFSSLVLVLSAPLLAAIALAIKIDSPGPVLFRQRRVGRDGGEFEMFKFRSMFEGSELRRDELRDLNEAEGLFKIPDDPRITRVGAVIRRWSLDELPQLVNVLRGEMSLVGPRPLVPDEDLLVEGFYRRRLDLAPGITGYWQVLGSARIPLFEMVRLDFLYIATWSLWNDVRIMLRTVSFMVGRKGL